MARVSIQDCLKFMENRFSLVTVAADRTRQLMEGVDPLVKSKNKLLVTALREVAAGEITAVTQEELDTYRRRRQDIEAQTRELKKNAPKESEPKQPIPQSIPRL